MKRIREPRPRPQPQEHFSSVLAGTWVLCAGDVLSVLSRGEAAIGWRDLVPGWYALSSEEADDWRHWATWTTGRYQCGGLSWTEPRAGSW